MSDGVSEESITIENKKLKTQIRILPILLLGLVVSVLVLNGKSRIILSSGIILLLVLFLIEWQGHSEQVEHIDSTDVIKYKSPEYYLNICDNLTLDGWLAFYSIDKCSMSIAILYKNLSICDRIPEEEGRRNFCIFTYSINTKDPKACLKIPDERESINCLLEYANQLYDPSVCETIKEDASKKMTCLYRLKAEAQIYDPKPEEYTCPPYTHIDCMPVISRQSRRYCMGPYRQWIQENCDVEYTD